jgi:spore coat polysaccharide biosynthesis predicted glycosyltransferase SpsG
VETQNAVYNCAVMQAKIKVIEGILKYVKSSDSSNIKTKMESQMQSLKTEINKRECNDATASVNKSYKEILLRGITYNYCNYRFYLNYLSIFPQYNVNAPPIS